MEKVVWMKHTDSVSTGKNEKNGQEKKRWHGLHGGRNNNQGKA
jgi:hypothetical protein